MSRSDLGEVISPPFGCRVSFTLTVAALKTSGTRPRLLRVKKSVTLFAPRSGERGEVTLA